MKKVYKQPSIEWLSIEEEQMVCESIPVDGSKKAFNSYSMDSKERNNVDFSSDSDWDF